MTINLMVNSSVLADLSLENIWGNPSLDGGLFGLCFRAAWKDHAKSGGVYSGRLSLSTREKNLSFPPLVLKLNQPITTHYSDQLIFEGVISSQQLERLEAIRNGRNLDLNLSFRLDADRPSSAQQELRTREIWMGDHDMLIPAEQWTKALENMGFRRSLFLEMTYPFDEKSTDPLAVMLKKARIAFERGEYDRVLGDVRQVLELLNDRRGDKAAYENAWAAAKNSDKTIREAMTVEERLLAVRRSVWNVAHLGHHPSNDEVERKTAKAMLAFVATLLELYPEP